MACYAFSSLVVSDVLENGSALDSGFGAQDVLQGVAGPENTILPEEDTPSLTNPSRISLALECSGQTPNGAIALAMATASSILFSTGLTCFSRPMFLNPRDFEPTTRRAKILVLVPEDLVRFAIRLPRRRELAPHSFFAQEVYACVVIFITSCARSTCHRHQ